MSADRLFPRIPSILVGQAKRMVGMAARSHAGLCLSGLRVCGKPIPSSKFAACLIIQLNHQLPKGNDHILNTYSFIHSLSLSLVHTKASVIVLTSSWQSQEKHHREKKMAGREIIIMWNMGKSWHNFAALRKAKGTKRSCSLGRKVWLLDVKYCWSCVPYVEALSIWQHRKCSTQWSLGTDKHNPVKHKNAHLNRHFTISPSACNRT